jgi:hypothetical protein
MVFHESNAQNFRVWIDLSQIQNDIAPILLFSFQKIMASSNNFELHVSSFLCAHHLPFMSPPPPLSS